MAVASALLLVVFQLGQTHRIDSVRAIRLPRLSGCNNLYFNMLWDIV